MTSQFLNRYQRLVRWTLVFEAASWLLVLILYVGVRPVTDAQTMTFLHPEMAWGLLLIPAVLVIYLRRWKWKSELYQQYKGMGKTRMLWVTFHPLRYFLQYFFLRNILFFIIVALAQPVMGNRKVKGSRRVLDIVVCLDVSSSMNTMDIAEQASRLTVAKRGLTQLINNLKGERISIVVFANEAHTELPLTMDYGAAKLFLQDIETTQITNQGTNIGAALKVAQTQFVDSESGHAILVVTDGEDHEQLWKEQVEQIVKSGIELSYFGIGTSKGGLIPIDPYDLSLGYKREGATAVVSRLDRAGLERMAAVSHSPLELTDAAFPDMTGVITTLSSVKSKTINTMEFTVQRNYFRIPLFFAFSCFLGYLFVPFFVNRSRQ